MFETICSFIDITINSKSHGNGTKSFSGNGNNEIKKDIKKSVATQTANG